MRLTLTVSNYEATQANRNRRLARLPDAVATPAVRGRAGACNRARFSQFWGMGGQAAVKYPRSTSHCAAGALAQDSQPGRQICLLPSRAAGQRGSALTVDRALCMVARLSAVELSL